MIRFLWSFPKSLEPAYGQGVQIGSRIGSEVIGFL